MDELQAGIEFTFAVLPKPAALFQPGEGPFDFPAFGQHRKGVHFIALDDLHCGLQALHDAVGKGLPGVAAIDQHAFHQFQIWPAVVNGLQSAVGIGHLRRRHGDGVRQSLRVHRDVSFDAGNLLARVISLMFVTIGVLYALRIHDQKAGHGVASLFGADLANRVSYGPLQYVCFRPGRVGSIWRNTNAPCVTREIPRGACATGNCSSVGTTRRSRLRMNPQCTFWFASAPLPTKGEHAQTAPGSHRSDTAFSASSSIAIATASYLHIAY